MTVVKWDPYRDVWTLQDRVNRLFQEGMSARQGQEDLQAGQWTPPVDIVQNAQTVAGQGHRHRGEVPPVGWAPAAGRVTMRRRYRTHRWRATRRRYIR